MKNILLLILFIPTVKFYGQGPKFETLKLTSAPAYTILGVDPQNIQRPATPTDFIAGAQSAIVNGKLQPNFAVEATPYYWKHPKNDSDKRVSLYNFMKRKINVIDNISETFTFSFASSESDTISFGDLEPGIGLGFGFKCNILNGNISRKTLMQTSSLVESKLIFNLYQSILGQLLLQDQVIVSNQIKSWKSAKRKASPQLNALIDRIADLVKEDLGKALLTAEDKNFLQEKIDQLDSEEKAVLTELNQAVFPLSREGFMLEIAFANAAIIQNNEWKDAAIAKTAIWITPSYRINTRKDPTVIDFLDFMGVIRFTWNSSKVDVTDYIDIGGKIQYTHNRLSFSGEYIARMLSEKPAAAVSKWTNRLDLSLDYKLNDFITFKATFGRNFDGTSVNYSDPGKMFAVGGLNFGFGDFLKMNNSDNK